MDEELEERQRLQQSGTKDILDAYRTKAGFDTAFPEGQRKKVLIPFVSRWQGPIPDAYDRIAAGVQLEMVAVLRSKALAAMNGPGVSTKEFDWKMIGRHPLISELEDLTISLGGGRGRREAVEMSKGNPPIAPKSRWSWRREGR